MNTTNSIKWISDRYKIVKPLGSGGSSRVYLARDFKDPEERGVAIKILTQLPGDAPELQKELFRREVRALSALSHPTIVRLLDSGHDEVTGHLYLSLEYIERAQTLQARLPVWKPSFLEAVAFVLEILTAISYAHQSHVIHRDLNPNNILMDGLGNAKIIDFGVSKILGTLTAGQTVGEFYTKPYAAPEHIMRAETNYASDVYSIAAILYFMATCSHPDLARPLAEAFAALPDIPDSIRPVVLRMSAADPTERYTNATRALNDLQLAFEECQAKTQTIYLVLTKKAVKNLYEQTILNRESDVEAREKIQQDLDAGAHIVSSSSNAGSEQYDIIGNGLSIRCAIQGQPPRPLDYNHFIAISVQSTRAPHHLERERKRGFTVHARWSVLCPGEPIPPDAVSSITGLLDDIDAFHQSKAIEQKGRERRTDLVESWRNLLYLDRDLKEQALTRVPYKHFHLTETGQVVRVSLQSAIDEKPIPEGQLLTMSAARKKRPIAVGHYLRSEGNDILISRIASTDLNDVAPSGVLSVDERQWSAAWQRQQRALATIVDARCTNPKLPDILVDPGQTERLVEEPRDQFFIDHLDDRKKETVIAALAAKDIFLVQGPPGTGKTDLITEIVAQLTASDPGTRILLVSQSNVAIDHVLMRLSQLAHKLPQTRITRIGRPEKIAPDAEGFLLDSSVQNWADDVRRSCTEYMHSSLPTSEDRQTWDSCLQLMEEIRPLLPRTSDSRDRVLADDLVAGIELLRSLVPEVDLQPTAKSFQALSDLVKSKIEQAKSPIERTLDDWIKQVGYRADFEQAYLDACHVVAGTCVGVMGNPYLPDRFDWAIVDEAGRATPSELLIPMVLARHSILVGDHKQLPPVIEHKTRNQAFTRDDIDPTWLDRSLFEHLFLSVKPEDKAVLRTQYRMHPDIATLISNVFYSEEPLENGISAEARHHGWPSWPTAVVWLSTSKLADRYESNGPEGSKYNLSEIKLISEQLTALEKHLRSRQEVKHVAVIAGYKAQIEHLVRQLDPDDQQRWQRLTIEINTVDAFQGREQDIVFYSVVRSNNDRELGFLKDARRLNVALSRARQLLIIIGDHRMVNEAYIPDGANPFKEVLTYMVAHPSQCKIKEVEHGTR
jgi:serine/threonine protein kinase